MSAILAIITLLFIMGMGFYAQWQMMKIRKELFQLWPTSAAVQFILKQSNDEVTK